jgi:GntR family transcriptional regulator/MocR family aminotransferase
MPDIKYRDYICRLDLFVVPHITIYINANLKIYQSGLMKIEKFGILLVISFRRNSMRIPLDRKNNVPLYQQIQNYLRTQIQSEQLLPGTKLPATRKLARDLGISRITVQNAYADLESEGFISSREGSGSYVLSPIQTSPYHSGDEMVSWPLWQQDLSDTGSQTLETVSAQNLIHTPATDLITFTGVGDPAHYPVKDFHKAFRTVINRQGVIALEYGDFGAGYLPLRQTITHILASQGIRANPENVLITSGSQQALALVCQILLKPGDVLLVEKPTYNLALDLFQVLDLKIVGVPVDKDGLQTELLEPLLQQYHPKLLYTIPNFQNPSGVCLRGPRRRELIQLAGRYNLAILEDDFAGDLRFEGRAQPAIKALDPGGQVIYVGTFSKMLMPGLRVGYLVAEGPIFERLVQIKHVTDLTTSTLIQHTLHDYVTVGRYQVHLRRSTQLYRKRRDAMLAAIKKYLPADVQMIPPEGGLFIWLRLPEGISSQELLSKALEQGIEFAPGGRFFPEPTEGEPYLRLNFATQTPDKIEEGIHRLALALARY